MWHWAGARCPPHSWCDGVVRLACMVYRGSPSRKTAGAQRPTQNTRSWAARLPAPRRRDEPQSSSLRIRAVLNEPAVSTLQVHFDRRRSSGESPLIAIGSFSVSASASAAPSSAAIPPDHQQPFSCARTGESDHSNSSATMCKDMNCDDSATVIFLSHG